MRSWRCVMHKAEIEISKSENMKYDLYLISGHTLGTSMGLVPLSISGHVGNIERIVSQESKFGADHVVQAYNQLNIIYFIGHNLTILIVDLSTSTGKILRLVVIDTQPQNYRVCRCSFIITNIQDLGSS